MRFVRVCLGEQRVDVDGGGNGYGGGNGVAS